MSSSATSTACGKKRQNHILSRKSLLKFLPRLSHTRSSTHSAHSKPYRRRHNREYVASKIRQPYVSSWTAVVLYPKRSLYDPETAVISNMDCKQKNISQYIPPTSILTQHALLKIDQIKRAVFAHSAFSIGETQKTAKEKSHDTAPAQRNMRLQSFSIFLQVVETKQQQKFPLTLSEERYQNFVSNSHFETLLLLSMI